MTDQIKRTRPEAKRSELMTAYLEYREDELLDAVVTAAALVGRADGRVSPIERGQLVDFLDRQQFLSVFTRTEVLDVFERRVRELAEAGDAGIVADSLKPLAGRSSAGLVIGAGEEVAAADGKLDEREQVALRFIEAALGRGAAAAPNSRK